MDVRANRMLGAISAVAAKLVLMAAALLFCNVSDAQQPTLDVLDKVVIDIFKRQEGIAVCMLKGTTTREFVRSAVEPRLAGVDLNDPGSASAMAVALYTQFPCPFSPYGIELGPATASDITGTWLFPETAQRLRFGPKSPNWMSKPGTAPVRCEGVAYLADGRLLIAQVQGTWPCPTTKSMAEYTSRQTVERWSLVRDGRIRVERSDVPGYSEESDVFIVKGAFDFAGDHFAVGDLLTYRRREPGNTYEASTLFRHLQRLQ